MYGPSTSRSSEPIDRDIDRVRDEAAVERSHDLLGDDQAGTILGLIGRRGQMRRHDDVLELQQLALVGLGGEDVERRARDLAGADRRCQRRLVDELAARGVDDPDAVAHLPERVLAHEAPRLLGQRQVEREEVGGLEDGLRTLGVVDAELAEALGHDERVVADHVHPEPEGATGHLPADPAEAEDAERLVGELDPAPARPLPAPVLQCGVGLRDVAGKRDEEADRVLRGGDDRRVGSVRDDDPAARRRPDVDVVDPDSRAADHLQSLRAVDDVGGQLRRRADDDRVVAADDLLERGVGVLVHVEASDAGSSTPAGAIVSRTRTFRPSPLPRTPRAPASPRPRARSAHRARRARARRRRVRWRCRTRRTSRCGRSGRSRPSARPGRRRS